MNVEALISERPVLESGLIYLYLSRNKHQRIVENPATGHSARMCFHLKGSSGARTFHCAPSHGVRLRHRGASVACKNDHRMNDLTIELTHQQLTPLSTDVLRHPCTRRNRHAITMRAFEESCGRCRLHRQMTPMRRSKPLSLKPRPWSAPLGHLGAIPTTSSVMRA